MPRTLTPSATKRAAATSSKWRTTHLCLLAVGTLLMGFVGWVWTQQRPEPMLSGTAGSSSSFHASADAMSATPLLPRGVVTATDPAASRVADRDETLRGIVLDVGGGPIAGASIVARASARGDVLAAVSTDAMGQFGINVPSGTVHLTAESVAYAQTRLVVTVPNHDVRLQLTPAAEVYGTVLSPDQERLAGVNVELVELGGRRRALQTQLSAADGSFRFESVAAGRHSLEASYATGRSARVELHLAIGERHGPVRLQLRPAVSLTAQVLAAGAPCRSGSVRVEGPLSLTGDVDAGRVLIEGLIPGSYRVRVQCGGALPLIEALEVDATPLDASWSLQPGLSIAGTVRTADGAALPNATILVNPQRAAREAAGTPDDIATHVQCLSDAQGTFSCDGLAPGEYECVVWGQGQAQSPILPVSLTTASTQVELTALTTASIVVSVDDAAELDPQRVMVFARAQTGDTRIAKRSDGEHRFENLTLGTYSVYLGPTDDLTEATATAVLSLPGEVVPVRLHAPQSTAISGVVVDEAGNPCIDAWVNLTSADRTWGVSARGTPVLTDTSGAFAFAGLLPGTYDLGVEHNGASASRRGVRGGDQEVTVQVTPDDLPALSAVRGAPDSTAE